MGQGHALLARRRSSEGPGWERDRPGGEREPVAVTVTGSPRGTFVQGDGELVAPRPSVASHRREPEAAHRDRVAAPGRREAVHTVSLVTAHDGAPPGSRWHRRPALPSWSATRPDRYHPPEEVAMRTVASTSPLVASCAYGGHVRLAQHSIEAASPRFDATQRASSLSSLPTAPRAPSRSCRVGAASRSDHGVERQQLVVDRICQCSVDSSACACGSLRRRAPPPGRASGSRLRLDAGTSVVLGPVVQLASWTRPAPPAPPRHERVDAVRERSRVHVGRDSRPSTRWRSDHTHRHARGRGGAGGAAESQLASWTDWTKNRPEGARVKSQADSLKRGLEAVRPSQRAARHATNPRCTANPDLQPAAVAQRHGAERGRGADPAGARGARGAVGQARPKSSRVACIERGTWPPSIECCAS